MLQGWMGAQASGALYGVSAGPVWMTSTLPPAAGHVAQHVCGGQKSTSALAPSAAGPCTGLHMHNLCYGEVRIMDALLEATHSRSSSQVLQPNM